VIELPIDDQAPKSAEGRTSLKQSSSALLSMLCQLADLVRRTYCRVKQQSSIRFPAFIFGQKVVTICVRIPAITSVRVARLELRRQQYFPGYPGRISRWPRIPRRCDLRITEIGPVVVVAEIGGAHCRYERQSP
jgi:hypothetical protein